METIQVVARGQKTITRGQEEIYQANLRAATANLHTPTPTMEILVGTHVGISPPVGVGPMSPNIIPAVNPPVFEVDNQVNAFINPRDESVFDEIERKVRSIEEKMKAMEGSNTFGLDVAEMCLVLDIQIPAKFKVPYF